jgi:hypothetical protein
MTLSALARYLFLFDRDAILAISADRRALWVGLLFVLSAGLAREYDAEYLLAEPWHLLIPPGASLVSAGLLYLVLVLTIYFFRKGRPPFLELGARFLALFWLTAPLAWIYAVPWERFLGEAAAAEANLWSLGIVAAWRVFLMIRVVSVIFGVRLRTAIWPVMLFADALAFAALSTLDARILAIMGGVRLSDAEQVLRMGALLLMAASFYSAVVWIAGTVIVLFGNMRDPLDFPPLREATPQEGKGPWILAGAAIAAGLAVLPLTQPEQQRRHQVESLLAQGDYDAALDLLCAHPEGAFPPHWDPPPRRFHVNLEAPATPDALEIASRLVKRPGAPEWVARAYTRKLASFANSPDLVYGEEPPPRTQLLLETLLAWPDPSAYRDLEEINNWRTGEDPRYEAERKLYAQLLEKRQRKP